MPQALIASGYEPWQWRSSKEIAKVLRTYTRVRHAPVFDGLGKTEAEFLARLSRALREGPDDDLLLVWLNMHGSADGWLSLDRDEKTHMNAVAALLAQTTRKVLLVVNSCHSGLMAEALERMGADPTRVGCIMACQGDRITYNGYLIEELLYVWSGRQVYRAGLLESHEVIKRLPPIGAIRVTNPLVRFYDLAKFRLSQWLFRIIELINPSKDRSIRSQRWGAKLDPWLWRKRRRRAS